MATTAEPVNVLGEKLEICGTGFIGMGVATLARMTWGPTLSVQSSQMIFWNIQVLRVTI